MVHTGRGCIVRPPYVRRVLGAVAVLALLAAGYAGMQLWPTSHATSSAQHPVVYDCPSAGAHC